MRINHFASGRRSERPLSLETVQRGETLSVDWHARYREAEAAREQAEVEAERLRRVLAGLGDGVVMMDADLRYTYVNAFTLELMGKTEEEVLGHSYEELYPELIGTPYDLVLRRALIERKPAEVDMHYDRNGKYWRTFIHPADGGVTVCYRDVSTIKATEIAQQRLAAIIESSDDAIIGKTLDGIITNWNPAAERMFGYTAEEIIGKPKTTLFPPDRLEEEVEILGRLRQGIATEHYESLRIRKDGTPIYVALTISPIRDSSGQIVGASTIARDITERKRTELHQSFLAQAGELLASSLDYQTTLQSVAQLIVPQLAEWCVISLVNDAGILEQVTVAHTDPAKVEFAHAYSRRFPPDPNAPTGSYAILRSGKTEWVPTITPEMIQALVEDEEQREILLQVGMTSYIGVPLVVRGVSLGVISLIRGQSDRPYDLEDVALIEEVARRAAIAVENARLYQAERERSEQLATAISEVHHRVKNSLQSVSSLLEMQIPDTGDTMPLEAVWDSLNQIKTIALVHDLLARDKPIGSVDVARVFRNLSELLSSGMSSGQQQTQIAVNANPVEMTTKTATALALAINELLTNAAKHQKPSGETSLRANTILLTLRREDDRVLVEVQDSGTGFPPNFNVRRDANIGLQLVRTLIEHDLHGSIQFRNVTDAQGNILGGRVEIAFPASACDEV
jgi:PAS domain S-box-containing protein